VIEYVKGNLFEAEAEALVNTVNTVGVMGKGVALQFSRQFPEIVPAYKTACKDETLDIGRVQVVPLALIGGIGGPKYVINFPTKKHWKGDSKIEYVEAGLRSLRSEVERLRIRSIAIPPLGCGLGGLNWTEVRIRIVEALSDLADVRVLVYEPAGAPEAKAMKASAKKPAMTPGRASLLGLMRRYTRPLMEDTVTLLEVHKLMYFLQEAGEPLSLEFEKAKFGPYALRLRHVLNHVEGHFLTGFGDGAENPEKPIELCPGAAELAEDFLRQKDHKPTLERFERVAAAIEGFETPFGLELLSSVHWVARHETTPATNASEAAVRIAAWNDRKRKLFKPQHVEAAWNRLVDKGWL
jgi:O-acetyl-ADP-ribose deacetylase (regulator of RNase III)